MNSSGQLANATAYVAEVLRDEILTGQLHGGAPVRENEVAERLGVSRTPVREAVGSLVAEGLLIKIGNRTAHVFRPSLAELQEIYEIRIPLESLAARLACQSPDKQFLADLENAWKALSQAEQGMDWSVKHEAFHLCLVRGSRRPRLESLVRTLRVQSEPYVRFAIASDSGFRQKAENDHAEIVRLAKACDAKAMERLVCNHLTRTSKHVSALLTEHQVPAVSGFAVPNRSSEARPRKRLDAKRST
jgi:DNA-binding GntR family transcriptional regulator